MKFAVFDEIKYLQTDKVILMQDLTQLLNILTKPAKKTIKKSSNDNSKTKRAKLKLRKRTCKTKSNIDLKDSYYVLKKMKIKLLGLRNLLKMKRNKIIIYIINIKEKILKLLRKH